jgi:hypothetical protein
VIAYAAYLRIYQPISAFHEPDRSRWAAYAASSARPRRRDALAAETSQAIQRLVTAPVASPVPEVDSGDAYVRCVDGAVYVCPWQTRLRCLLASGPELTGPVAAIRRGEPGERFPPVRAARRVHIRSSLWHVPLAWFVPFDGAERWVAVEPRAPGIVDVRSGARALLYATPMSRARRRVARGLASVRALWAPDMPDLPDLRDPQLVAELAEVGCWLERFHPNSLVELDYGGLVNLLSDDALNRDESVAELGAALEGIACGQSEVALAMYARVRARWRAFSEFEQVN